MLAPVGRLKQIALESYDRSPVPGGVGPMTIAVLLAQTVEASVLGLASEPDLPRRDGRP